MTHDPGPASCFPELSARHVTVIQEGWDSEVVAVAGEIVRVPRRRETQALARAEARILPILAEALPVAVPVPERVCPEHGSMRYRRIPGEPASTNRLTASCLDVVATQMATFLAALRQVSTATASQAGIPDLSGGAWRAHHADVAARFADVVLPHLPKEVGASARRLLDATCDLPGDVSACVVHADLGPAHLLCDDAGLRGVIDWGNVAIGDPAIDLAWMLNGAPREIGQALRDRLRLEEGEVDRARLYHQLGPWYEVEHGLRIGDERFVASGVQGVVRRLMARP